MLDELILKWTIRSRKGHHNRDVAIFKTEGSYFLHYDITKALYTMKYISSMITHHQISIKSPEEIFTRDISADYELNI